MRAFMSGPNEWGTANDYCRHCAASEEFPALRYNASATEAWISAKQRIAEGEARAILAETEAVLGDYKACYSSLAYLRSSRMPLNMRIASDLAEALAAFVND